MPDIDVISKTTVVNVRREKYDVYIGRPSAWGNPFALKQGKFPVVIVATVEEAIDRYRAYIMARPDLLSKLHFLKGKRLGCYCQAGRPCHGQVLAELADAL